MMRASHFRYLTARTSREAAEILAGAGPGAMLLAGGTDLVPNMKRRQQTPGVLVSLRQIDELRRIEAGTETVIGACATLADIVRDPALRTAHHALFRASAQVATPLIRNTATIGGNLCLDTRCNYYNQNHDWRQSIDFCKKAPGPEGVATEEVRDEAICWVAPSSPRCWAVSSSDTAPALIALGARVKLLSAKEGEREIPLEALYHDDGMSFLTKRPDEVLTTIAIPANRVRSTYWKLRRRGSFDFPTLGVAAALRLGADQVVEEARIVLGAVASRPIVLGESSMLVGKRLTDDAIEEFAEAASKFAKPLDNTDFHMSWRKAMAKQYLAGVLHELRGDEPRSLLERHAGRALHPTW
jgi:4-hydroxybenzoyl-CoA reductase subunit beta